MHWLFTAGLLITFIFLALNASCKPYCTVGLSHLHSLTLVAQFITLFGGLVIIVEDYIQQSLIAAGEIDTTTAKVSIISYLVYLGNGAVLIWPSVDWMLQTSPSDIFELVGSMFTQSIGSGEDSDEDSKAVTDAVAMNSAAGVTSSGPGHNVEFDRSVIVTDSEQQTQSQDLSEPEQQIGSMTESIRQVSIQEDHGFELAGGVRDFQQCDFVSASTSGNSGC
jgi:hypothetical protein